MAAMQIRKAERKQAKLRVGVNGPSGSGKTYSGLLLARGIAGSWDKVLLIDTENGSGELYSDLGAYNIITLDAPYTPERFIEAIHAAEDAGMAAIVIDSVSHEWDGKGGCLELVDSVAQAKFKGNNWAAWSEVTPRHRKFLEAILTSPAHIITTARNKTDTVQTDDKKVKKVGVKEIQRDGFEYELTINFNVDRENHLAVASKDRTGQFDNRDPFVITIETGEELRKWNEGGAINVPEQKKELIRHLRRLNLPMPDMKKEPADFRDYINYACEKLTGMRPDDTNLQAIIDKLITHHDTAAALAIVHPEPTDEQKQEAAAATAEAEGGAANDLTAQAQE